MYGDIFRGKSKRVRWGDIAKGLLMIIVVISHMDEATNVDDTVAHVLNGFESIYNSFFMGVFCNNRTSY